MQLTVPVLVHPQLPAPAALPRVTGRARPRIISPLSPSLRNAGYG
jgi:hypothetical protein